MCKTHYYTNCYVSYFMLICLTCEYANILLMWSTFSLLVFFFFNCDTLGVQVIHVINLYHYNDKNHDWINWKKKKSEILFLEFSNCNCQPFEMSYIFMLQFWHFKFGILSHNLWDKFCFASSLFLNCWKLFPTNPIPLDR